MYLHHTTWISVILFLQLQYRLSCNYCENYIQLLCLLDVCAGGRDEFSQGDDKWGSESVHGAGRETQIFAAWGANMTRMPADSPDPGLWCPCSSPEGNPQSGFTQLHMCECACVRVCEWITRLPARWATGVKIRCEVYVWWITNMWDNRSPTSSLLFSLFFFLMGENTFHLQPQWAWGS